MYKAATIATIAVGGASAGTLRRSSFLNNNMFGMKGQAYVGAHGFSSTHHDQALGAKELEIIEIPVGYKLEENFEWGRDVVGPARNQESCGSCWAFASAGAVESCVAINNPGLKPAGGADGGNIRVSEQQLLDCAPNPMQCGGTGGCGGSTQALAMQYYSQNGFDIMGDGENEAEDAYKGRDGKCASVSSPRPGSVGSWAQVANNDLESLMYTIKEFGPVTVAVDANAFGGYSSGILKYEEAGGILDHAVLATGYGCDTVKNGEHTDCWIKIRNSWGPSWGECRDHTKGKRCNSSEKGFIRIERLSLKENAKNAPTRCQMDTRTEDGLGCKGKNGTATPRNTNVCGTAGVLYKPVVPLKCTVAGIQNVKSADTKSSLHCEKMTCNAKGCKCDEI